MDPGRGSRTEHLLGLTPVLWRAAFYFLRRGVGDHPTDVLGYDLVRVRVLYDWVVPDGAPGQGGFVVEFWRGGEKIRWVEFGCRAIGGGGDPIIREV